MNSTLLKSLDRKPGTLIKGWQLPPTFWQNRRRRQAAAARRITTCPPSLRKLLRPLEFIRRFHQFEFIETTFIFNFSKGGLHHFSLISYLMKKRDSKSMHPNKHLALLILVSSKPCGLPTSPNSRKSF